MRQLRYSPIALPWLIKSLPVAILVMSAALPAIARVGGGQSYSGGGSYSSSSSSGSYSSSGSSSGSSDGGAIFFLLEMIIRLVIYYPKIGIPLVLGGSLYFYFKFKPTQNDANFRQLQDWSSKMAVPRSSRPRLGRLKERDPNFSETLFFDFVNSVYTRVILLVGQDTSEIGAYLSQTMRAQLEVEREVRATAVVIGAYRLISVGMTDHDQTVKIEVEANIQLSNETQLYVVDHITFQRQADTQTNSPETVYTLSCPHCGNSSPTQRDGCCTFCGEKVNDGRWSWVITNLARKRSTTASPVVLSNDGIELGTDLPTERSPDLNTALAQLQSTDPGFDLEAFQEFSKATFLQLQQAWTNMNWEEARPLETDFLFGQHQYWINGYKNDGLRNVLEDVAVTRLELSRVSLDKYFESITIRVFAQMKDYTIRVSDGQVVSGFPDQVRKFSEYWTFVRRTGVTTQQREATQCPNCGAPLDKITQVGVCEYCDTQITRGDFDWILSRIEQDEAYFL